ncbi:hypothetical protein DWZ75_09560 [Bacteroides stercoris]|uniref:Uncharacterized protein n=1 Tax=Bacteroides stercoris TaxID=46506 RepID=A0A413ZTV1_BACSE|nr:hypothetical protein DW992_08290 [Bacteroides stercoris]RHC32284.1 hypothetical protein DW853_04995 [Bacteroides stercoris]RHL62550.1 hypothetical protein DW010_01730 [Bacteroides stercoris]RHM19204.1 hypothetical protein DWZ78_07835 [Bacteroides stercoris]RHM20599.1 hypothetical protein DWZ75_09560 [Bacteroides stercoris]
MISFVSGVYSMKNNFMYVNVAGVISIPAHLCGSFKLFPLQSHVLLFLSLCFLFRMNFFKATDLIL